MPMQQDYCTKQDKIDLKIFFIQLSVFFMEIVLFIKKKVRVFFFSIQHEGHVSTL